MSDPVYFNGRCDICQALSVDHEEECDPLAVLATQCEIRGSLL